MLSKIIEWDKELMVCLNAGNLHNDIGDHFMWLTSQTWTWSLLFIAILYTLIIRKKKNALYAVVFLAITILLCDQISSGILKPFIGRLRPSHDNSISDLLSYVHDYKGGKYGFPSSHAANTYGIAMFLSLIFRNKLVITTLFLWAIICSYSRIYLGVHFPTDILVGVLIGLTVGFLAHKIYDNKFQTDKSNFSKTSGIFVAVSFIISLSIFLFYSNYMVFRFS